MRAHAHRVNRAGFFVAAGLCAALGGSVRGADTTQPSGEANQLELETDALSTLNDLQLDAGQLAALKDLCADTAGKPHTETAQFTPAYVGALSQLRTALLSGDSDRVDAAEDKVSDAEDQSDKDLGIDLDLSDAARTKAEPALKLLTPRQLASYISAVADDVPDMSRLLVDLVDESHAADVDFAADRDDALNQLRILTGGANSNKPTGSSQKARKFLDHVKQMSADDFTSKKGDLETEARELTKSLDPFSCVHHWVEHDMAELLSNPQLLPAMAEWHPARPSGDNNSAD